MVIGSKPLLTAHIKSYFNLEYKNPERAYYTEGNKLHGFWHGRLAEEIGLKGPVLDEHFDRLAEGKDPYSGTELLRYPKPKVIEHTWALHDELWTDHLTDLIGSIAERSPDEIQKLLRHPNRCAELKPLELPKQEPVSLPPPSKRTAALLEMNRIAAEVFQSNLTSQKGEKARQYLSRRGVSDESIKEFAVGVSDPSGRQLAKKLARFGPDLMEASGLFYKTKKGVFVDRFRDRIMFPIQDEHGRIVAFGGRSIGQVEGPKYVNSRETELYKKSATLYNLHRAKENVSESGRLVTVEGYLDVVAAHSAGVKNVIGLCGTAFKEKHIEAIAKHVKGVTLSLDMEDDNDAGRNATLKHSKVLLETGLEVSVARIKGDPDDFVREAGAESYRNAVWHAEPIARWIAGDLERRHNLDDMYGRIDALNELAESMSSVSQKQRTAISRDLHKMLGIEFPEIPRSQKELIRRAGYDFTFSPAKSISVTALVGGDERIREWHRAAVKEAADFGERYVQARMGGNRDPLTTGKWIAAAFEHDTSRPVNGYAAPQLHTHLVIFNMTATDGNGRARSIQPKELYNLQSAMSRVYQNRLAMELLRGGYELERGKNHAPEIKGYSREYLEWESPRRMMIQRELEKLGIDSRRASDIVAKQEREGKLHLKADELRALHRAHGETYGQPADRVVREARERSRTLDFHEESPKRSVDFALRKLSERHSVVERDGYKQSGGIIQNALTYSQGRVTLKAIEQEIERRKVLTERDRALGFAEPELVIVNHYRKTAPGERYATRQMRDMERQLIEHVISRKGQYESISPTITRDNFRESYSGKLTNHQMYMVWDAMTSKDQVIGINGAAGAGKTFAMNVFAKIARDHGYTVQGLTPTSSARKELERSGIPSKTVAKHNLEIKHGKGPADPNEKIIYLLDESSLAGTGAVHKFLINLRPQDRAVLIGDIRQHQSIDAGRIFHQLQLGGMTTIKLDKIMRQRENPALLDVVRDFQRGDVKKAVQGLDKMECIQAIGKRSERFDAIARKFSESPSDTMVVSPDNQSRSDINQAIRRALRESGRLGAQSFTVSTLVSRNELYAEDIRLSSSYEQGGWMRAGRSDKNLGIRSGDYLQIVSREDEKNLVTVMTTDGKLIRFNPDMTDLRASLYRVETREYSVGDKIQLTAQWKQKGLANRERGTIESMDERGNIQLRMEAKPGQTGRLIPFNLREFSHIDYGYSMTSYSSQSMTIRNILVQIDTQDSRIQGLLDKTLAYVASSRASHNLTFFTDEKSKLTHALDRMEVRPTALSLEETMAYRHRT